MLLDEFGVPILKAIGKGAGRLLTPAEKDALRMANTVAKKEYEAAIASAPGGVIDPSHPIAVRENILGLNQTGLNLQNLPTGKQLLNSPKLADVEKQLEENAYNFDVRNVEGNKGEGWYEGANDIARIVGQMAGYRTPAKQIDVGAALLAKTSPKTQWDANIVRAKRAALGLRSGELQKLFSDMEAQGLTTLEQARQAGLRVPETATAMNPNMFPTLNQIFDTGTGVGVIKGAGEGVKTDAFYTAIRLPARDRRLLQRLGVMDKNERILDPEFKLDGVRLGNLLTLPVVDKFEASKLLGVSGAGYGVPLKTLDDALGYEIFANALLRAAQKAGVLTPNYQSRGWVALHDLYPNANLKGGVGATGQIINPSVEETLNMLLAVGKITPQMRKNILQALNQGGLF